MWLIDELVRAAAEALQACEEGVRSEQAVRGLDALDEVALHPILAAAFGGAGYGVLREQPFPSDLRPRRGRRGAEALAHDSERRRCDLVLTERPGMVLADPLVPERRARARREQARGTLFEPLAGDAVEEAPAGDVSSVVPATDAFWLEVKAVGQWSYECGVPGPNRTYTSQLLRGPVADLAKLRDDPLIESGGVLLVHFTADLETAQHDQIVLAHRCLDRGATDSPPVAQHFPIVDRIGNAVCSVCLLRAGRGD
ncbi:MAG: hypothetical protein KF745_01345 [Phycisphaeraceae bacterium]|nr:hypothetical protein [Phycisphaeraceae bacterium]